MDLIDKQEVRLIESDADAYPQEWNDDYEKGFCDAIHKVLELPTVDAKPVKLGRWIECDSQPNQKMCSSCRGVGVAKDIAQFFTYCPFCGAYMRGDTDDGQGKSD